MTVPAVLVGLSIFTRSAMAEAFAAGIAVAIILPPLAVNSSRIVPATAITLAAIGSLSAILLLMPVRWSQYFGCVAVIASVGLFVLGATSLLRRFPIHPFACSMFVTVCLLLWFSWPIWLSGRLVGHESVSNALVVTHPLLTINAELLDQAIWTERPLMYEWTALNQDVPYAMPSTIWWTVALHGGVGFLMLAIAYFGFEDR